MAVTIESNTVVAQDQNEKELKGPVVSIITIPSLESTEITRLPREDDTGSSSGIEQTTTFHVYQKNECHKCISPTTNLPKERRLGPSIKQQKAKRKERKERTASGLPRVDPDENAFFLHGPYLAFHVPPRVLYMGNSKHNAKPVVLIHEGCFWREYKLQLGPSISKLGVLDSRSVVAWRHNGGDKKVLKGDNHKLKGYKVRTWRLWGETGKNFVHTVKANREAGEGFDPDLLEEPGFKPERPATAEEVVYLRWMSPLSRHTRCYHFQYAGIDFYWKGTGAVKELRLCGFLLRFNHLKLVARLPATKNGEEMEREQEEVTLGTYTSSVAQMKNGTMEFADAAILRLLDEHAPSMLARSPLEEEETEAARSLRLKRSTLYQVFIATAMCMIKAEKEKRCTLMDLVIGAAEQGGGAG